MKPNKRSNLDIIVHQVRKRNVGYSIRNYLKSINRPVSLLLLSPQMLSDNYLLNYVNNLKTVNRCSKLNDI